MIFCDTSAAAKLYVPERESGALHRHLASQSEACLSELARVELMRVFHRRLREGKWSRREFLAAVRQFSTDDIGGFWTWLPLDKAILVAAAQTFATLPNTVFLGGSDCIHLVTALHHGFDELCTYESHQSAAAAVLGLKVTNV